MRLALASPFRRWMFLLATLLPAALLTAGAGRRWQASILARSADFRDWERATRIEPRNAAHWHQLGRFWLLDFEQGDLKKAAASLERATALNPLSDLVWLDLASAYEFDGQAEKARAALEKARASHPISAEVAWSRGNFLLRQGELESALSEIRRSLTIDPRHTYLAISLCWRATGDAERIFREALPPQAEFYLPALQFFVSQREFAAALAAWKHLLAQRPNVEPAASMPLIEGLIQSDRFDEARTVWQQALAASGTGPAEPDSAERVWDGGFEREFTGGGFGWRQVPAAGVSLAFDTAAPRAGARSLRAVFDGSANVETGGLGQYVLVQPRTRYRFSAQFRSEELSTDSGPYFRLTDARHPAAVDVRTRGILGSQPWTAEELEFVTGPESRLLRVALVRAPSRKLDNRIRGTLWMDGVSLTPISPVRGPAAP
jgi:Tfp pilus assembly protein PilF